MQTLIRLQTVIDQTGLSRSTIYALMARNQFPKPVKIAERCVAWPSVSVQNWISQKVAEAA